MTAPQMLRTAMLWCMVVVSTAVVVDVASVSAANRGPLNEPESDARELCNFQSRGAIWFSNNPTNYYETGVTVVGGATSVPVYLRGSSNTCYDSTNSGKSSYAIRISSQSGRLTNISGTLFRGMWPSTYQALNWTSQGNSVAATLDVSGLADGTTISVNVYRCPSFNGVTIAGNTASCYADPIPITIKRIPAPASWSVVGRSAVNTTTAVPGQAVTFSHYIRNTGASTTPSIYATVAAQYAGGTPFTVSPRVSVGTFTAGQERLVDRKTYTIPATASAGQTFCQRLGYDPISSTNSGSTAAGWACVRVILGYSIVPSVTGPDVSWPGQTVAIGYVATKTGSQTNSTSWEARSFELAPGVTPDYLGDPHEDVTAPATFYAPGTNYRGTPGTAFTMSAAQSSLAVSTQNFTIPMTAQVGSRYCFVMNVNPRDQDPAPNHSDSAPKCVLIASLPYLSMVGGDARAMRSTPEGPLNYSVRGATGTTFGSFGEYGVMGSENVQYFGSGGKLGVDAASNGMVLAPLTFSNTSPLGNFGTVSKVYDPGTSYAPAAVTSTTPLPISGSVTTAPGATVVGGGLYKNTGATTVYLNASTLTAGTNKHAVVYVPNGTVRITGTITYNSAGATSFGTLPSLTIIAKNIEISGAAERVDAYMYVSGQFVSCAEGPRVAGNVPENAQITPSGACSKQLTLNGALHIGAYAAGTQPVFNRSFGGLSAGQPAEIFRMRPEVFLSTYEQSIRNNAGVLRTIVEKELPPRY